MIISAHQPILLPWLGFWSKLKQADLFVLMDEYQFSRHSSEKFDNRNKIRNPNGEQWITIPCQRGSKYKKFTAVKIDNSQKWQEKIWNTIEWNYRNAPYWESYKHLIRPVFRAHHENLVDINVELITLFAYLLDINTPIYLQSYDLPLLFGDATEKLVFITKFFNGDEFLFGAHGKRYCREMLFKQNGIRITYQDYKHPTYKQMHSPFIPNLSVVDAILNIGEKTKELI